MKPTSCHKASYAVLSAFLLCVLAANARAGKLEYTFTQPDPESWEVTGLTDADFKVDGLHFAWPQGDRTPKFIMSRKLFVDDLNVQADFVRVQSPLETKTVIILDNPDKKRRAEMVSYTYSRGQNRQGRDTAYGGISYFKDGAKVGTMYGVTNEFPAVDRLRLRLAGKRVYGSFPVRQGEKLVGWYSATYPRTDFDEDTDEFHVGFMVMPPDSGEAAEVVLKGLTIIGPQAGGAFIDTKEAKVLRFDFGPVNQEVAEDYIPVSQFTHYTTERGYGWKTDLAPMEQYQFRRLTNEESIKNGLEPSFAEEDWRRNTDLTLNWLQLNKVRPLLSIAHGWDRIDILGKTLDLKLPQEKDAVFACRHYGFPHDYRIEADQWERRGAIYVDDPLEAEFVVDVPNGRYNAILGVGLTVGGPYHGVPIVFSIDAEGRTVKKGLNDNWEKCDRFRIEDMEVNDGQLNLRFYADRRVGMNEVASYNVGCGWMVNYLVLCPAENKETLREEEWRLIVEKSRRVRQLAFEPGTPAHLGLVDGYMELNGKPYLPILLQYSYSWPRTYYGLYTWANCWTENMAASEIGGAQAFFQSDWERMSMWDNYPWRAIAQMNGAYQHGQLDWLYVENFIYIVPKAIQGEGGSLQDNRGRSDRWNVQPPLGSRLSQEIIRESYTMLSNQLKLHPSNIGYYVYEEFVHPYNLGYDHQSLARYRDYLRQRYGTITTLNQEWRQDYKSFDEVAPPKREWELTPEWRNFWMFRRWSMTEQIRQTRAIVENLEPEHATMGQKSKPDPMSTAWYTAEYVDLFGHGGPPNFVRPGAKYYRKALTQNAGYWDCPYAWCDGRRQLDHKPQGKRYLGKQLLPVYNDTVSKYFQGTKGFWSEEYNDGVRHMFHRTTLINRDSERGKIKTWFGDIVFFDDEAKKWAPVTACLPPLRFSRAAQLGYRLGPLFLPAQVPVGSVAVVQTEDSFLTRGHSGNHQWLESMDNFLTRQHVPYDVIRQENIEELKNYDVAVLAGFTETVEPVVVQALDELVKRGGKVILLDHALGIDARTLSDGKPAPLFGFDRVAGCTYRFDRYNRQKFNGPAVIAAGKFLNRTKVGDRIAADPYYNIDTVLEPAEGATVVAKVADVPVGVMNADNSVFTLALPHFRIDWQGAVPLDPVLESLLADVLDSWRVRRPMAPRTTAPDLELRHMQGEDCWLAAAMNRADQTRTVSFTLGFLPQGSYDVMDVTGERPLIVTDANNGLHLASDAELRQSRYVQRNVSSATLASTGLTMEIDGIMARVLLIRPADQNIWVNVPARTVKSVSDGANTVVVGDKATAAELAAADRIIRAMKARQVNVELRRAADVKIEKTRNEVWVSATSQERPRGKEDGYLVDVFENAPLVTDGNLILVGSADTNEIIRHLAAPNTFTYDKMLQKVSAEFPGKGRGLIELVECVNRVAYDATCTNNDAILVGGSDDAGTQAAVDKFLELLAAKVAP